MTQKKHFKLYKSGKKWCIMAITVVAMAFGMASAQSANADEVSSAEPTTVQTVSANQNVDSTTAATSDQSATPDGANEQNLTNHNSTQNEQTVAKSTATNQQNNVTTDNQQPVANAAVNDVDTHTVSKHSAATEQQNGWVKNNNGGWTYYTNGQVQSGRSYSYLPTIPTNGNSTGHNWYLVDNGVVQSGVQKWAGTYYDFDPTTYLRVDNNYVKSQWGDWYMFGPDGRIATKVYKWMGTYYYFDPSTYLRVDNDYRQSQWGDWYMFGPDGKIATGVYKWAGTYYYFDPSTYLRVNHDYRQSQWGDWYMFGEDGRIVTGLYGWKGSLYYFNPGTYLKATNQTVYANGKTYWANASGIISGFNSINNYILNNRLGHANIYFYDNGQAIPLNLTSAYSGTDNGRPNMVVVHETANPNDSIWGEINFEKNHYDDAFVHAFVDGNNIIQISNTDHEAWGAAYPANGRAVQFEQIEVHNGYQFARELSNAAYYTAYIMHKYGMDPSLAQSNGTGTLWSHHNVSQYLGGTDHTDPDGYWWTNAHNFFGTNYTMSDFYELVSLYAGEM